MKFYSFKSINLKNTVKS